MIVVHGTSRSGHHFVINMIRSWVDVEVVKSENRSTVYKYERGKRFLVNTAGAIKVIQTRDYLNWLASWLLYCIQRGVADDEIDRLIGMWLNHSEEYFKGGNVPLLYDRFVKDQDYRKSICTQVGGIYNEEQLNTVPRAGKGSSFNGGDFDGRGSEMSVNDRWTWFQVDGQEYKKYIYRNADALKHYVDNYPKAAQLLEQIK